MAPLGRLHLITDNPEIAKVALSAGAPVIQVRVSDGTTDREAFDLTRHIRELCHTYDALCLVNDRLHIAVAAGADGGHVGADDLPVAAARQLLGPAAVLGATARDPDTARAAVADGASYLGVGPAYATTSKDGLPDAIGPAGVSAVAQAVPDIPVIAIGGVTAAQVSPLRTAGAYGVAVIGAVAQAADPAAATRDLLRALDTPRGDHAGAPA